jgi:hypothetical protein
MPTGAAVMLEAGRRKLQAKGGRVRILKTPGPLMSPLNGNSRLGNLLNLLRDVSLVLKCNYFTLA